MRVRVAIYCSACLSLQVRTLPQRIDRKDLLLIAVPQAICQDYDGAVARWHYLRLFSMQG